MARDPTRDAAIGRGIVLRAAVAAATVVLFLVARDALSPRALVTARFGLGVALFALLVDVGRTLVGTRDPVHGEIQPHRQRAEPMVDDRYERVHEPVQRFVDQGVLTDAYEQIVREALTAEGVPAREQDALLDEVHHAADADRPAGPPLASALAAGLVVTIGLALATGTLMEALTLPVTGPVVVVLGMGIGLLQLRAHDANARGWALGLGIVGAATTALGGLRLATRYPGPWWLVLVLAGGLLVGTVALFWLADTTAPPWRAVETQLTRRFEALRRAFLAALLAGGVLFPFEPLLEELFLALAWSFKVPYRLATIAYGTLAAYLALEMAGTWFGLSQGQARAAEQRRRRLAATTAILERLDQHAHEMATTGGRSP